GCRSRTRQMPPATATSSDAKEPFCEEQPSAAQPRSSTRSRLISPAKEEMVSHTGSLCDRTNVPSHSAWRYGRSPIHLFLFLSCVRERLPFKECTAAPVTGPSALIWLEFARARCPLFDNSTL